MDSTATIILASSLIIVMLGMGLSLEVADFKRIIQFPKAVFVGLMNQLILLPLIGLGVVLVFPMDPEIAIGVMILAACPGGPTSNLISFMAKADLALSVSLTALSSVIAILTIPFIVNFALTYFLEEGKIIELNVLETILQIFVIVVIPIIIGMFIRKYKPVFAVKMSRPVKILSALVLALIIAGIVIKERAHMTDYFQQAGLATLVLNAATMAVGYLTAMLFKLKSPQAFSIAIESGIQNGTLAITIAVVLLHNTSFAIAPAVYSLIMFLTGGIIIYLSRRKSKEITNA
jgi:BASS family bile acid:Na+ symporter